MINESILNSYRRAQLAPELLSSEIIRLDRLIKGIRFSANQINFDFDKGLISDDFSYNKKHILKDINDISSHKDRLVKAFNIAEGRDILTLDLLIANYMNYKFKSKCSFSYFFNRYLSYFGVNKIFFENRGDFFQSITNNNTNKYNKDDLVSVIMPTFNNEETVEYACFSILNQDYSNIELIVVDDCSTDKTYKIVSKIKSKDKRVKLVKNPKNSGAYFSRNVGVKIAEGDYITILDGDDWSFPDRISYQLNRIKETNGVAHLGYYLRLTSDGYVTGFRIKGKYSYDGALHKCLASLMIKRDFFDSYLGFWDTVRFGADSELYGRILALNQSVIEDVRPLILALDRNDSLTKNPKTALGSKLRSVYANSFTDWHCNINNKNSRLDFPLVERPFYAPSEMVVSEH